MLLWILFALVVFLTLMLWTSKIASVTSLRTVYKFFQLPQADLLPFFGAPLGMTGKKLHELQDYVRDIVDNKTPVEGTAFCFFLGFPSVISKNAEVMEVMMSSMKFIEKGPVYHLLNEWLSEGLLLSKGEKWKQRRRLLTPSFHFKILDNNLESLNKIWQDVAKKFLSQNGAIVNPHHFLCRGTLDVITETAMGVKLDETTDSEQYVSAVRSAGDIIGLRASVVYYYSDLIFYMFPMGWKLKRNFKLLHEFTRRVIQQRREAFNGQKPSHGAMRSGGDAKKNKKPQPFLDALIELDVEQNGILSDQDIQEEVDTFMFEGHDTTAAALLFALFELGLNPDIQERAYQEQCDIFGHDYERNVTNEDLNQMNYLEQVVKEVLRLYPPVPFMSRLITEDITLPGGHLVPAESVLNIMPHLLHRNPKYFPDPNTFDPDRFSTEEIQNRHPFAFIPFSAGPRNCIGQRFAMMELKTALSTLLRFTKIETISRREDIKLLMLVILRPSQPIYVRITPRQQL